VSTADAATTTRYGEIYDRGYRHYDGPRLGRRHAIRALTVYSMKRALGIKKGWGSKVIPILLYVAAGLPVVVYLAILGFVRLAGVFGGEDPEFLSYPEFFQLIFVVEGLFVATIAPEMLCGDRRENVLPLYFSRAITRADYLLAKLVATAILTLTVSFAPAAILWLGRQLLLGDPLLGMRDNLADLGRIAVAGVLIAFYLGAIGLMISSFTGRKAIAVGIIILGFLLSESIAGALSFALDENHVVYDYLPLLSASTTIVGLLDRLFGVAEMEIQLPLWLIVAEMIAVIVLCTVVMILRYVPDE
jgi:ABC-2 type transport system permease protein